MALLADAGHNLGDVASLAISLLAFRLTKLKPTEEFTYGYRKTTILAALINSVVLLLSVGIIGFEAVRSLFHPHVIAGGTVAAVAVVGIIINMGSALLFFRDKEHDLNTKSAYLHLLTDALLSMGVVISGIIIYYTGWNWLDSVVSIMLLLTILAGTWNLLTSSFKMSMDAVPANVNRTKIETMVMKTEGVRGLHHMHIWAMSTTENALTAHLVLNETLSFTEKMKVVHAIKHELLHMNIHHATVELESMELPCNDEKC
jgi:cobalt-zinc-cadmium efflux system protein